MADLCLVADVQTYLGISTDTTLLGSLASAADKILARFCNRPYTASGESGWLTATHTEYFNGDDSNCVVLTYTPITAVTSAARVYQATSGGVESATVIDLTRLSVDGIAVGGTMWGEGGRLAFRSDYRTGMDQGSFEAGEPYPGPALGFPWPNFGSGTNRLKVVYTAGYANQAAVPDDLEMAATIMTCHLYAQRKRDPALKSETLGKYSYTTTDGADQNAVPPHVAAMLGDYIRRPSP